jgi:hypothetical protein
MNGSMSFVENVKALLGFKAKGRNVIEEAVNGIRPGTQLFTMRL